LVRRWFNGELTASFPTFMGVGAVYHEHFGLWMVRDLIHGAWRSRMRPQALIFAGRELLPGWTVIDRPGEIKAPTLVVPGVTTACSRMSVSVSGRRAFPVPASTSSTAQATVRTRSRPPRLCV
jgi:hypothetical protein